jgi:hypothetical protein
MNEEASIEALMSEYSNDLKNYPKGSKDVEYLAIVLWMQRLYYQGESKIL